MNLDPNGEQFTLASLMTTMAISSTISISATYIANHALGKETTIQEIAYAGIFGAIAGPVAVGAPTIGVGLGALGITSSSWLIAKVFNNSDSTYFQKSEAVALFSASMFGARVGFKYLRASKGTGPVPKFPINAEIQNIRLESAQSGLRADKVWQIPGMMKSMLDGTGVPPIGGYKSGNRYIISEGNHRMAAAIELAKQTNDARYITMLLENGRFDPIPQNITTYKMTR